MDQFDKVQYDCATGKHDLSVHLFLLENYKKN